MPAYSKSHRILNILQYGIDNLTAAQLHYVLNGAANLQQELAVWLIPVVDQEARIALQPIAFRYRRDLRDVVEEFVNDIMCDLFLEGGKVLRAWNPNLGMTLRGFVALIARRTIYRRFRGFRTNPWSSSPADVDVLHGLIDDGIAARHSVLADVEYRIQLDQVLSTLFSQLNDRDWRLFTKLFIEQRSPAEVAVDEQIEVNSVHKWRSRFHVRVRKLFSSPETNSFAGMAASEDLAVRVRSLFADGKLRFQELLPSTVHPTQALLNRILQCPEHAPRALQRFNEHQPSSDDARPMNRRE